MESIIKNHKKILLVCLGNICRSPLAEGIFKSLAEYHDLNLEIKSAGTSAFHEGSAPDRRSIAVAKKHNIDISKQRARQLLMSDLEYYDFILVMDESNYNDVIKLKTKTTISRIELLRKYSENSESDIITDPYYGTELEFEQTYQHIYHSANGFINMLKALN